MLKNINKFYTYKIIHVYCLIDVIKYELIHILDIMEEDIMDYDKNLLLFYLCGMHNLLKYYFIFENPKLDLILLYHSLYFY
jgi:hypothetical protein